MSAELPASNPFRRRIYAALPSAMSERPSANSQISADYAEPQTDPVGGEGTGVLKKITKKVRVHSPPPPSLSSPTISDSSSTVGNEIYNTSGRPTKSAIPREEDPFENATADTSDDEETSRLGRVPANPFSKTLETMENPGRGTGTVPPRKASNAGRASMDVDAFKRLLMTGNSGLATPPTQTGAQAHVAHALGNGGSSTDTTSLCRQSVFEAIQEPLTESPRTSHEISEPDDDRRGLVAEMSHSSAGRKKPPPPSSRHGKMINMELKNENTPISTQSPPTSGSITSQHYISSSQHSQTDLNKPLPPAPNRASHDSERESIFDKESAGKTPEPPSPSPSLRYKTPPAPPLTRRHSQKMAESKLRRAGSTRLSPNPEEEPPRVPSSGSENRRKSSESARAPPPPPSRRLGSLRVSPKTCVNSPSTVSLPAPPPARRSSRSLTGGRPSSVYSLDLSSTNKRSSVVAPPPPPPRHHGTSPESQLFGDSQRRSGEYHRSTEVTRPGSSSSSSLLHENLHEEPVQIPAQASKLDVLADLSKLQREIDALRTQSVKRIT
ncbi:uncharacterized protein L3040_003876 [Drepanopeziza brunnea f. sp. 'multigermtubi']|nr:hypothetical protein L3040_003876 [Drepanopeziza brunnea f. sp. 'multigermtubi']